MHRSKFHPVPITELHPLENYRIPTSALDDDNETLNRVDKTGNAASTSRSTETLSVLMHLTLVAVHFVLVAVWSKQLEHGLVFSLEHQKIVSLLITAITTTFGTIYSALLVFMTQNLSMKRTLQKYQTLTSTHDNAAAWAGIGSAAVQIWKARPASVIGILWTFLYLGSILILHITTPALFSLETFTSNLSVPVETQSLPAFNATGYNLSDTNSPTSIAVANYATGSLYFLPSIFGSSTSLGLSSGSLYDVIDNNGGVGNVTVNATGFNISCGYVTDVNVTFLLGRSLYEVDCDNEGFLIPSTQPGVIANLFDGYHSDSNILLYSTIPILDSSDTRGPWINLDPPMNTSVSTIQVLRCSQTLVHQTAVVDAQARKLLVVTPNINKTASVWKSNNGPIASEINQTASTGNAFLDAWATLYQMIPSSDFYLDSTGETFLLASFADLYLIQTLNLHPANYSNAPSNVTLHEVENALSVVVASMFWTLGHIAPISGGYNFTPDQYEFTEIQEVQNPLVMLGGEANVTVISTQARLDLSVIAVAAGLATSIALLLLSLPGSIFNTNTRDVPLHGTGILHAIWLYRNHPELEALLEQVDHPTDQNLRAAGMVRTTLAGGESATWRRQDVFNPLPRLSVDVAETKYPG
ncbi:hypothetical protein DFH07DRAFT_963429 [Mycena maculata]|uniref:Uncharacterized protein n=1 Tax=Mycena maculata TaxID=230809 RepID=A0AAD7ILY0_9AGAR|nr:hypothetical protein DFH07DRAFT_963429 [Mycena maculata]